MNNGLPFAWLESHVYLLDEKGYDFDVYDRPWTKTGIPEFSKETQIMRTNVTVGEVTPWSVVLPAKLTGRQPFKKSPAFNVTRRFITAFTSLRHLSISSAR